ncbi:MAG TPA: hypothetical protein PKY56_09870 [Candidatus Kapabacteria bacterium]|nr:hypothetical protein [Candidatus Kapabacteria bacterium]HPO63987.1 hypothetical protein [Candidatus Kapabacteria bacterium]
MNEFDFITEFKDRPFFTKKELYDFLKHTKNDLTDSYYRLLLSNLRKKGIIEDLKRNIYTINTKPEYLPAIEKKIKRLINTIQKCTKDIQYVSWDSIWLNRFTTHQSNSSMVIYECEKEFIENIYYILKDNKYENVYLNPKKEVIDIYLTEIKNSIIIKPLISRSPNFEYSGVKIPTLEKILVDIFSDHNLFFAYQGKELENIFINSISDFKVNFSILFNYAKRRNKYKELLGYIRHHSLISEDLLFGETVNDK